MNKNDTRPIGMLDSGVGGITVLKEVLENVKNEDVIYYGDTKSFPYGNKSKKSIIKLTKSGIDFLVSKNVKAIVIACGTATSQALEEMRKMYNIPIIGIIEPTVKYIKNKKYKRVGVVATSGTIRSKGWENNLVNVIPDIKVESKACPSLAQMAEEGWIENDIAKLSIKEYLKAFEDKENLDAFVLGCTHYPLFTKIFRKELGNKVDIINTGIVLSYDLKEILKEKGLENDNKHKGNYEIYLTDTETNFVNVAKKLLPNLDNEKIKQKE